MLLDSMCQSQESWYRAITRSAAQIRKRFGVPDQPTEDRMVRAFRAALRPRKTAGRKLDEATARAAEMWTAGIERAGNRRQQRAVWQRMYREVFPRLSPHGQAHAPVPDRRPAPEREGVPAPAGA